jgi:hypothetical protein
MINQNVVYRGKISSDVLVFVKQVSKKTNTVTGIAKTGYGAGIPDATISYRYDTFLDFYEESDVCYSRVTFKVSQGEVVAFLWDVEANKGNIMSYMRVGQHGEASIDFYRELELATPRQYKSLYEELQSVGYFLDLNTTEPMPTLFKEGWI